MSVTRQPEAQAQPDPETLLFNANVLTMDPALPRAQAVTFSGERIVAVGTNSNLRRRASGRTKTVDCQGLTLLPGFNDAHCHLLALARTFQDLDCHPDKANSLEELQDMVQSVTLRMPEGTWVRGFGYDSMAWVHHGHPTRWDLDKAAPDHPVRLDHRSGHVSVLNSLALKLAGIHRGTPDPVDGVIQRTPDTGEPTGVLLEMTGFLQERLGNLRSEDDLESSVMAAARQLLSYGITSVQDAGAGNGVERWATLQRLSSVGTAPRITMFAGAQHLHEFLAAGMDWGDGDHHLRLGHAKFMLTGTTGALSPDQGELGRLVSSVHQAGFPVAVHCIEQEAVEATAAILAEQRFSKSESTLVSVPDRIEHCAECPPQLVDLVLQSGATVVTQPGFIYWNGPAYRERVSAGLQPHLYPAGALHRAGISLAFGSDAPVIDPNPWPAIYSAATGLASDRRPVGEHGNGQTVDLESALRMYTLAAAWAEGTVADKGSITSGKLADLVLVDTDPLSAATESIKHIRPVLTVLGGRPVFMDRRYADSW